MTAWADSALATGSYQTGAWGDEGTTPPPDPPPSFKVGVGSAWLAGAWADGAWQVGAWGEGGSAIGGAVSEPRKRPTHLNVLGKEYRLASDGTYEAVTPDSEKDAPAPRATNARRNRARLVADAPALAPDYLSAMSAPGASPFEHALFGARNPEQDDEDVLLLIA